MRATYTTLILFIFFLTTSTWAQKNTPLDPLDYLTNFEAVPAEDGVLNLILHRGTGEVVLHLLDENLEKVHESLYNTTPGINDYIIKVKNGKVYILLSWLSNHYYKKEVLEYSIQDRNLHAHLIGASQVHKPTDFLVFEESFAIIGQQKDPIIQVYGFDPSNPFRNTIFLPEKKIWHISDADNSINLLTSPKGNHQILEWQQYLPDGEFAGQMRLDTDFRNKDIVTASLVIDSNNNPRVIGTTGKKKLKRYHAFFHWVMDNDNRQAFSIIEPQSLAERNNGLDRKQRKQLNYERKKGFNQVEILAENDGDILVASIPGKPVSRHENIYKKQIAHFLRLDSKGEKVWDKVVAFDYTTRYRLNEHNYRRETFTFLIGDDLYFGHKDNIRKEDSQIVNIFRINEMGEMTNFTQELPPGLQYGVKHLTFNEIIFYNESPLFQGADQPLDYFMGKLKIQEPYSNLSNKN
ncbi:hypothetical protein KI659_00220 [Litoribacter alkaliphilus]|uniref:Uncharacterized protein n=1 Tax=Litoribacter ruber TaxID=702568 RepID=A0AAP2CF92_9BACT|nr:hypothetical protein [Litoribacter alkaliphilus]MBS9522429.1 hypothetical protein [Litoribacter alkaliphilus]